MSSGAAGGTKVQSVRNKLMSLTSRLELLRRPDPDHHVGPPDLAAPTRPPAGITEHVRDRK